MENMNRQWQRLYESKVSTQSSEGKEKMPSKKTQKRESKQREVGAAFLQREMQQVVSYLNQQYLRE